MLACSTLIAAVISQLPTWSAGLQQPPAAATRPWHEHLVACLHLLRALRLATICHQTPGYTVQVSAGKSWFAWIRCARQSCWELWGRLTAREAIIRDL